MSDIMFATSISTIKKNGVRLGIWIKMEFETEKVKHYLVDISIEEENLLTVYENACIGLDSKLIDSTSSDGVIYREKVFDILTSSKVQNYIKNEGYFNNLVYINGNIIKERYQSIDKIMPTIRKDYPFKVKTKDLSNAIDRAETLRIQFEESDGETVEDAIVSNRKRSEK